MRSVSHFEEGEIALPSWYCKILTGKLNIEL